MPVRLMKYVLASAKYFECEVTLLNIKKRQKD